MKKIKMKSSQIFESHSDSFEKEYDAEIERLEDGIKIVYDNTIILIQKDMVHIQSGNNTLNIEKHARRKTKYHTPYGVLSIETEGKEIIVEEDAILLQLQYLMKVGNTKEYTNHLQIIVVE